MSKEKESLVFHHGDDYSVWKKKTLGHLYGKLDSYGLELNEENWGKENEKAGLKVEVGVYKIMQRKRKGREV